MDFWRGIWSPEIIVMRRNRGSIVGEFNQPTQRKSSGGRSMLIMGEMKLENGLTPIFLNK